MTVYLYAIRRAGTGPITTPGLNGHPLRAVAHGGLEIVAGDVQRPPSADAGSLAEHERVIEELMGTGAVLPMRFASTLPDDEQARALLRDRAREFISALRHVEGAVEMAVRVEWPASAPSPATPPQAGAGTAYLLGALERRRRAEGCARRLDGQLSTLARGARHRVMPRESTAVAAAYLVDRDRQTHFRRRALDLARELARRGEGTLTCTGPWPPYGFTSAEDAR